MIEERIDFQMDSGEQNGKTSSYFLFVENGVLKQLGTDLSHPAGKNIKYV